MPVRHRAPALVKLEHGSSPREAPLALPERRGLSALSGREREIGELVSDGCTNQQIARTLSLSEKTVETYLSRVFTKLGVSSRAAVATAITQARPTKPR